LISDAAVKPDEIFFLKIAATDPDGDKLKFGVSSEMPPFAEIDPDSGEFTWKPPASMDNKVVEVAFFAADSTGKAEDAVKFAVGNPPEGKPPVFKKIGAVEAQAGKKVVFEISAEDPDNNSLAYNVVGEIEDEFVLNHETGEVSWTPPLDAEGQSALFLFSVTDGFYTAYQEVKVNVGQTVQPLDCEDDQFEPNNDVGDATQIGAGTFPELSICDTDLSPVDMDWFAISLKKGAELAINLSFKHSNGDIDMDLSTDGSVEGIVAISDSSTDNESIQYKAENDGTFFLAVYGVGYDKYANKYSMKIEISEPVTCKDDILEQNNSYPYATKITGEDAAFNDLTLCGSDSDFFELSLSENDSIIAEAVPVSGSIDVKLLGADGFTVIKNAVESGGKKVIELENIQKAGKYYLKTSPLSADPSYSLEIIILKGNAGCTSLSCQKGYVCDFEKKECVFDFCYETYDCPSGYVCIDTYCVDSCENNGGCRIDYACKWFPEGKFCGVKGEKKTGEPCNSFAACADERVCYFQEAGGYCAVVGCYDSYDCPLDAWCTDQGGTFCAKECSGDWECNNDNGFYCDPVNITDGGTIDLCVLL
ncbi:MAG: pre-peptidase C-terminal domain-containing protein, partial [Deltaproteobacteria bacterium]|nr:pre-peptidase C-terminal domain-containing protein [Deltaproteobacteria bacterium]